MSKSILLVDDDVNILETAQDILEAAGYHIETALSGADALKKLNDASFGLMVVDFNLTDMTGTALSLQARERQPGMAIIMMTGEASIDPGPARHVIHSILIKPVNPPELIALIRRIF